jgi:DNA mismatch repair protein mutL
MGKIVLLDDSTINKIAAGEVIERPASVVKEVMENSIDAGATAITVEIRNGGISYIRVTDNGKGIMQDDLEIAFERHATSKLRSAEDLDDIKSMGFRGEALASIASIAKVSLISKTADSYTGYEVVVEGGKILSKEEAGCPNGTSITIENLFYNTPVRYKFLKKDFTESGYIEDVVTRIALVHPEIAVKLINTGKTIIQTSGNGEIKPVIYNIYGKEIADNLIDIDYTYDDIIVKGVIGKPVISRSNRSNQLFFVNNRFVKDKALSGAAEQAFKGFVTIGKHGFLVLNIDMDPRKVDVNVHPAKLEVRFQEETKIFKAIYHAIREGLLKGDLVAYTSSIDKIDEEKTKYSTENIDLNPKFENVGSSSFRDIIKNTEPVKPNFEQLPSYIKEEKFDSNKLVQTDQTVEKEEIKEHEKQSEQTFEDVMARLNRMQNVISTVNEEKTTYNAPSEATINNKDKEKVENSTEDVKVINQETPQANSQTNDDSKFLEMYEKTFGISVKKEENEEDELDVSQEFKPMTAEDNVSVFEGESSYATKPAYKYIGIAFNTYIIIEMKSDLYIIDQHAAHERIMYEKIKQNYYSNNTKDSQLMLLPDIITLTHKEMGIYRDNKEMFQRAGFAVEEFGENTVKLSGVPNVLIDLETKDLFLETLDEINTVARTAKQEIEEKFIATVACKAAVKAHMVLEKQEVTQLLDKLLQLPNPFTCPHGRPTAIKMTRNDIEKKFSRR